MMIVQGSKTGLWKDIADRVSNVATIRAAFEPTRRPRMMFGVLPNSLDAGIALASEHGAYRDESDAILAKYRRADLLTRILTLELHAHHTI